MKAIIAMGVVVFLVIIFALGGYTIARADTLIYVKQGSIYNHQCNNIEWHFVITQVSDPNLAPVSITVQWQSGDTHSVPLRGVTGQTAHYYDYSNLDNPVVNAWTSIYDGWSGEFNVSHGPCFETTPTPTNTEVPSATPTPSQTHTLEPTSTPTNTATPTETSSPTASQTATYTKTPTMTPTDDPGTNTPTATGTQPTSTATVPTPTLSPTPTSTRTPTPTSTFTATPTSTSNATSTPRPPEPDAADGRVDYDTLPLGVMVMNSRVYTLYSGINAPDGSLLLPSSDLGVAYYNNGYWVHRVWNSGWLNLQGGDIVTVLRNDGKHTAYYIVGHKFIEYGEYPDVSGEYIATCYSSDGKYFDGVEIFLLVPLGSSKEQ